MRSEVEWTIMIDRWTALRHRWAWPLVVGDGLAFVVFSAIGRRDHGEATNIASVIGTAAPFVAGWLLVAPLAGAFPSERRPALGPFLVATALAWLYTWPVALLIRAVVLQRGIKVGFAIVALAANAVFLLAWRGAYGLYRARAHDRAA